MEEQVSLFNKNELAFLHRLTKEKVAFMVVGLSAAALHGAPVVTQDIDLWFRDNDSQELKDILKEFDAVYVPCIGLNPPSIAGGGLSLFDIVLSMSGLGSFDEEMQNIEKYQIGEVQIPVLSLERIIKSKECANRKKDQIVLPVLKDALKAIRMKKD